jgi:hypothetical protein
MLIMIFSIIGFASLAHLLVDLIETIDTNNWAPRKPFKCDLCMGFWLSVWPLVDMYGFKGILAAAITGVTSDVLYRLKERI